MSDPGAPLAARPNGTPLLYAALGAMFHLEAPVPEDGDRLEQVNAAVHGWFGHELRWTLNSAFGEMERFRPEDLEYIASHPSSLAGRGATFDDPQVQEVSNAFVAVERAAFAMACHGGADFIDASPYSYRFYSDIPDWDARRRLEPCSMLRITVPASWPLADFHERICAIAATLRLRWGAAGLLYSGWEIANYNDTREAVYAHARRHFGFDIAQYATLMRAWHEQVRTVNWLTFIGPAFRERLAQKSGGEIEGSGPVEVFAAGDSVVLRAGAQPDAGDQNRLRLPPAYVRADEMIRPLRARSGIDFMDPWTAASTERWLCRFEKRLY